MADDDAHFRIVDEALRHPDGRAKGGEPCVICGNPVPATTHWTQRDRHVCSQRCNANLRRRFGRGSPSIEVARVVAATDETGPLPNPRTSGPRLFATVHDPAPGQLPIEWEGYGPIPGDLVQRYGVHTVYSVEFLESPLHVGPVVVAKVPGTRELFVSGADSRGFCGSLVLGAVSARGYEGGMAHTRRFEASSLLCQWRRERIVDLQPDGVNYYFWDCYAAVPVEAPECTWTSFIHLATGPRCTGVGGWRATPRSMSVVHERTPRFSTSTPLMCTNAMAGCARFAATGRCCTLTL